jgi:diguanylate cyclase (GGDEF)-like protein
LILPESAPDAAREKTEWLRQAIATLVLSHAGQNLGLITMSFGIAIFPEHGSDSAALFQAADMALYQAKNEGRNRVEISRAGMTTA